MLRRPKVQFKPKLSSGRESKQIPVKKSAAEIITSEAGEVSTYVAVETSEICTDSSNLVSTTFPISPTNTVVIEPRETPVINILSSQESYSSSVRKRARGSKTTIEVVDDCEGSLGTPQKQWQNIKPTHGQPSKKKPKICLSSGKQNLPMDRSKVTMYDLLSYNPPLSEEQKEKRKEESESCRDDDQSSLGSPSKSPSSPLKCRPVNDGGGNSSQYSQPSVNDESDEPSGSSQDTVEKSGPRVKIAADGSIIIDEESLIVKRVDTVINESSVINEGKVGLSSTNYESFRKRKTTRNRWTEDETLKFYHALSAIGTDFSLMADTFFRSSRSRQELRNKFKKEEKTKSHLIDSALAQTNLKYATDYLEKANKKSSPSKSSDQSSPLKQSRKTSPVRKSPRNLAP